MIEKSDQTGSPWAEAIEISSRDLVAKITTYLARPLKRLQVRSLKGDFAVSLPLTTSNTGSRSVARNWMPVVEELARRDTPVRLSIAF